MVVVVTMAVVGVSTQVINMVMVVLAVINSITINPTLTQQTASSPCTPNNGYINRKVSASNANKLQVNLLTLTTLSTLHSLHKEMDL